MYHKGKYRFEPSVSGLVKLLNAVCETGATTDYIRVIPFYYNYKLWVEHEFDDDYMFFIKCRQQVTEEDVMAHLLNCTGRDALSEAEQRIIKIRFPLCQFDDADGFACAIRRYIAYLDESIPQLMAEATKIYDLKTEDIGYGFVMFEIHSN